MLLTRVLAAAVLVRPRGAAARGAPPGVAPDAWWRALTEDCCDVVAALSGVRAVVASGAADADDARALAWPGTAVVRLPAETPADADALVATLDGLTALGASHAVVVAGDAPDVPGLLLGKLFSALEDAPVSVCPARGGGLVALAALLPAAAWLRDAGVGLDTDDALARLHDAAPRSGVVIGAGWHRLRQPGDLGHLDADLEGWDATRTLLSGR